MNSINIHGVTALLLKSIQPANAHCMTIVITQNCGGIVDNNYAEMSIDHELTLFFDDPAAFERIADALPRTSDFQHYTEDALEIAP